MDTQAMVSDDLPRAAPRVSRPWPETWPSQWDGDDDKLLNRDQTARALTVALPTLDRMVRDGCPLRREGGNGRPHGFYLPEVWAWREGRAAAEAEERRRQDEQIAQAQLALSGGEVHGDYALPLNKRREFFAAELMRHKVARERGELVPSADLYQVFEQLLTANARFLQALPERLGREMGWDMTTIAVCQAAVDEHQETFARLLMARRLLDAPIQ